MVPLKSLRGHYGSGLSHIRSAMRILVELQSSADTSTGVWTMSPISDISLKGLNLIFSHWETQMILNNGGRRILVDDAMDDMEAGYQDHIPRTFSSFSQARNSLDHIWTAHARYLHRSAPQRASVAEVLLMVSVSLRFSIEKFTTWSDAFEYFLRDNRQQIDHVSQIEIHVLKAQIILASLIFSTDYAASLQSFSTDYAVSLQSETVWEAWFLEYEAIINHSASAVKLESQLLKSNGVKSTFTLDSGIVSALMTVAVKCRHKTVRRKAISILKSTPRQEGVLSSPLIARIIERLVEVEEDGIPNAQFSEDIPNSARVARVHLDFGTESRRVFVKYEMWKKPGILQEDIIEDCIEW
jgi:hypothetical protein